MFLVRVQTMTRNRIHVLLDRYPEVRAQRQARELFTKGGHVWLREGEVPGHDRHILESEVGLLEHLGEQIRGVGRMLSGVGGAKRSGSDG
jgi:transposase